ncbi:hypothetical protein ENUP19_0259G0025 [Entamoeba nuttalli]|uniref:Protein phosphatase domain containing protein n=2 Tax=Entamoeba nuttalli TaxID=412467 RepID=K2H6D1_ENTNP|nr:protein phosphatase domain containing protein [Entamoeba nuttalli P19]EKE38054.1 protein phosphatase domain containing protein [Entamoeba nuttalli P19]|eukprot:XP_008859611.1 protein phosphatase domain containing protein [Entamoeba nuttalli P19]
MGENREINHITRGVSIHIVESVDISDEAKYNQKRPRTRGNSFYGRERPVFNGNKQCLHVNSCILPNKSWSIFIPKGTTGKQISGEPYNFEYTFSKSHDIGVSLTIGKRNYMEDEVLVAGNVKEGIDLVGIFDGHNGSDAAKLAAKLFKEEIKHLEEEFDWITLFEQVHSTIIKSTESGTTATLALIYSNKITVVHCGDSTAFALKKRKLKKLTHDQNTSCLEEVSSIKKNGGVVEFNGGILRVNGQISVTRSLGDKKFHPPLTCIPEVIELESDDITSLVLTSDGISSVLQLDEIEAVMNSEMNVEEKSSTLRNQSFIREGKDNMSVIVVSFN